MTERTNSYLFVLYEMAAAYPISAANPSPQDEQVVTAYDALKSWIFIANGMGTLLRLRDGAEQKRAEADAKCLFACERVWRAVLSDLDTMVTCKRKSEG